MRSRRGRRGTRGRAARSSAASVARRPGSPSAAPMRRTTPAKSTGSSQTCGSARARRPSPARSDPRARRPSRRALAERLARPPAGSRCRDVEDEVGLLHARDVARRQLDVVRLGAGRRQVRDRDAVAADPLRGEGERIEGRDDVEAPVVACRRAAARRPERARSAANDENDSHLGADDNDSHRTLSRTVIIEA